jgi:hypothetical protein
VSEKLYSVYEIGRGGKKWLLLTTNSLQQAVLLAAALLPTPGTQASNVRRLEVRDEFGVLVFPKPPDS